MININHDEHVDNRQFNTNFIQHINIEQYVNNPTCDGTELEVVQYFELCPEESGHCLKYQDGSRVAEYPGFVRNTYKNDCCEPDAV